LTDDDPGIQYEPKKEPDLQQVNKAVVKHLQPAQVEVEICRAEEVAYRRGLTSELDEMWSDVGQQAEPRWLWHAIDPHSGTVVAYVFGRRKDAVFLQRQALLEPCGIRRFYTDGWGADERHIAPEQPMVGKENTQKIASKHLNLRTRIKRLVRRTICFSNTTTMHDLGIGLFINRYEFGRLL
jgi:insertion element IS1 protein InsB